jgi:hypothetical protein
LSEGQTQELIKNKFDSKTGMVQIISEYLKLSLVCPISQNRIRVPARGIHCTHVECFDIESFLLLHGLTASQNCPICNKSAPLLKIDLFFSKILDQLAAPVSEIELSSDSSWRELREENEFIIID